MRSNLISLFFSVLFLVPTAEAGTITRTLSCVWKRTVAFDGVRPVWSESGPGVFLARNLGVTVDSENLRYWDKDGSFGDTANANCLTNHRRSGWSCYFEIAMYTNNLYFNIYLEDGLANGQKTEGALEMTQITDPWKTRLDLDSAPTMRSYYDCTLTTH